MSDLHDSESLKQRFEAVLAGKLQLVTKEYMSNLKNMKTILIDQAITAVEK